MRAQTLWWLGALGLVGLLYLFSRTRAGADAAQGAIEFVDVSAARIGNALTSRGYRNHNPGNIRFIAVNPFNGQVGNDGGYGIYDTPQSGTRALGKQLAAYERRGLNTVRAIIATWAPAIENNTGSYVQDVAGELGVDADAVINVTERRADLARAIASHENGYLDSSYDWNWVYLP